MASFTPRSNHLRSLSSTMLMHAVIQARLVDRLKTVLNVLGFEFIRALKLTLNGDGDVTIFQRMRSDITSESSENLPSKITSKFSLQQCWDQKLKSFQIDIANTDELKWWTTAHRALVKVHFTLWWISLVPQFEIRFGPRPFGLGHELYKIWVCLTTFWYYM